MKKITRRKLLLTAAAGSGLVAAGCTTVSPRHRGPNSKDRPNFLFLLTDDQTKSSIELYKKIPFIKSPNINRIAEEGMRFDKAFVTNSLCGPSRATFMTGLYSNAHGMMTNDPIPGVGNLGGIYDRIPTFGSLLRDSGYHTAIFGKWHIRSLPKGFSQYAVLTPDQGEYFNSDFLVNGEVKNIKGHADDVIGDLVLECLKNRPKDAPFCIQYASKAAHANWLPAPRFSKVYENEEFPMPKNYFEDLSSRVKAIQQTNISLRTMGHFSERGVDFRLPPREVALENFQALSKNYHRCLLGVDENIGRILDFLDKQGLVENTVVVFATDNGFFMGEHGFFDKRLMYEPAIQIPFFVRYPGMVSAGTINNKNFILNVDLAPTFLELANVPSPKLRHGESIVPLLTGQNVPWRDSFYYQYFEAPQGHRVPKHRGIRTEKHKLIQYWERPEEWELFDLENDPDEMVNLYPRPSSQKLIAVLKEKLNQLRARVGDADASKTGV